MSVSRIFARSAATMLAVALLAMLPAPSVQASALQIIPSSPTLLPNQSEMVSVQLTANLNFTLTGADIEIVFDSSRFAISNVQLGTLDTGNGFFLTGTPDNTNGLLQVGIATTSAGNSISGAITPVVGTLETFTLTALTNAGTGGANGDVALYATVGRANTGVYSDPNTAGAIALNPAPTSTYYVDSNNVVHNNFNYMSNIDGTVTVLPEPSSLAMMGIAGLASLAVVIRKKARRMLGA